MIDWGFQAADGYWEIELLDRIAQMRNDILDKVMSFFSLIGEGGAFWILFALVLLFVGKQKRQIGWQMLLSMLVTFIIGNLILKNVFDRPRPFADNPELVNGLIPHDASFPSGHTMNSFTAAVAILMSDRKLGVCAVLLACVMAFSRLYNYCHFPTDVLGGMVIGIVNAVIVCLLYRKYKNTVKFI